MKSVICLRDDDAAMRPLYRHLASLQSSSGKRYRARVLCTLLELGASILFSADEAASAELVRAAKCIAVDAPDAQADGRPIRVDLLLPDTIAMQPLLRRMAELPGGQGAQARSRLVLRALQAAVQVVYRDLPVPAAQPSLPATSAPASAAAPASPHSAPGMGDFIDNLSLDGL